MFGGMHYASLAVINQTDDAKLLDAKQALLSLQSN